MRGQAGQSYSGLVSLTNVSDDAFGMQFGFVYEAEAKRGMDKFDNTFCFEFTHHVRTKLLHRAVADAKVRRDFLAA